MKRVVGFCLSLLMLFVSLNSCMTFTDFQSAKTVGKGNLELTPHLTGTFGEDVRYPTSGMTLAYGVSDRIDLRASASTNLVLTSLSVATKWNVIKDKLSFNLPVGTFLANSDLDIDRVVVLQPTLLLTMPIKKGLDLTLAPQYVLLHNEFSGWQKPMFAPNIGFSIQRPGSKFELRPELGATFWPEYTEFHLGLGLAIKLEGKQKKGTKL